MQENDQSSIEKILSDYIELTEMSRHYGRKQNDLKKEYNKLLTEYNGEAKNYSLAQADKIYTVYKSMQDYEEKAKLATESMMEASWESPSGLSLWIR